MNAFFPQIDAIFVTGVGDDERFEKATAVGVQCADGGSSPMFKKENQAKYKWLTEGMNRIRENGDYHWLCNMFSNC